VDYERLILDFASIIYEALPFVVLGVVLAGLLEEFVPQQFLARVMPKSPLLGIGMGALLGSIFPMCECGIIVVMRRLLRKGLPLSVCVSYVLAGPIINIVVLTSTYVAFANFGFFGGPFGMVLLRAGLGFVVACVTATVVDRQYRRHGKTLLSPTIVDHNVPDEDNGSDGRRSWWDRLNNISGTALNDFVDIMAFLILGAILASWGKALIRENPDFINPDHMGNPFVAIPVTMALAILFCLCSEADAFVAAAFPLEFPPASKLAFLVLGPMFDLKLLMMYTRVFRPRLICTIVVSVVVQVFVYCLLVHYWPDIMNGLGFGGQPAAAP
jgi:uncharacterized protein